MEVIYDSLVSWWECRSCEVFMLCMSGIIYLFVVILCRGSATLLLSIFDLLNLCF